MTFPWFTQLANGRTESYLGPRLGPSDLKVMVLSSLEVGPTALVRLALDVINGMKTQMGKTNSIALPWTGREG